MAQSGLRPVGATPQDVGPGVQPPPSKPHPAHGVGALPGEPPANCRPSGNRSAHAPVVQRGRSPAPRPLKAGGQPGRCPASSRSRSGGANSDHQGKHSAGCPPVGAAVQRRRVGGAVCGGVEGVQPERLRAALAAKEQPCSALDTVEASASTISLDTTVSRTVGCDTARFRRSPSGSHTPDLAATAWQPRQESAPCGTARPAARTAGQNRSHR